MKPIAASFCSQTVSSVSSLDWSNGLEASFHFPATLHQLGRQRLPSIFLSSLFCVIAVSLFFHVPSHLHVSISSSHHVFSLSQPFSFWQQCKASIIEWCMGVCVCGIEGLGTPPAPPAEEALTAEHRGLIPPSLPPSSYAQFHISTDLPSSSSSHTFSIFRFLPRLLFIPCCSAHISPASGPSQHLLSFSHSRLSTALFAFSYFSLTLCPLSLYYWLYLNLFIICRWLFAAVQVMVTFNVFSQ